MKTELMKLHDKLVKEAEELMEQSHALYEKSGNDDEGWSKAFILQGRAGGLIKASTEILDLYNSPVKP